MPPITVAIADRERAHRFACARLLHREQDIRVVARIAASDDVLPIALECEPRILLCSLSRAETGNFSLLRTLRHHCKGTLIVLFIEDTARETQLIAALVNGARALVDCRVLSRQLADAVRAVDRGEAWVPRRMLGTILARVL